LCLPAFLLSSIISSTIICHCLGICPICLFVVDGIIRFDFFSCFSSSSTSNTLSVMYICLGFPSFVGLKYISLFLKFISLQFRLATSLNLAPVSNSRTVILYSVENCLSCSSSSSCWACSCDRKPTFALSIFGSLTLPFDIGLE
jgi:multisubunit Na+/H+ antiporter MnhG subunit